jgi:hypothetical protein
MSGHKPFQALADRVTATPEGRERVETYRRLMDAVMTRLRFTSQPSWRSSGQIRRYPWRDHVRHLGWAYPETSDIGDRDRSWGRLPGTPAVDGRPRPQVGDRAVGTVSAGARPTPIPIG